MKNAEDDHMLNTANTELALFIISFLLVIFGRYRGKKKQTKDIKLELVYQIFTKCWCLFTFNLYLFIM